MRRSRALPILAAAIIASSAASPPQAREEAGPPETLRGIVDRVEEGGFLLDGARVEPSHHARFTGRADALREIQAGTWATVEGHTDGEGTFVADWIVTRRHFPGHSYQDRQTDIAVAERTRIEASGALYDVPEVRRYVEWVGTALVPEWARQALDVRFEVIEDPEPNALALPDGTILVHTGLLAAVENDAQLAAILGHEVAHVTQYHAARGHKKGEIAGFLSGMGGVVLDAAEFDGAGEVFLALGLSLSLDLAGSLATSGYGQAFEEQADRVGLRYVVEAGFEPMAASEAWRLLEDAGARRPEGGAPYFYASGANLKARRQGFENEIRLRYGHPGTVKASRKPDATAYRQAMLPLIRDHAVRPSEPQPAAGPPR